MSCEWMKKDRAFWIFPDGLAINQGEYLFEHSQNDSFRFTVTPPDIKASGQIHDSYITGKFSRNMIASGEDYDNVIKQMQMEKMDPKYFGIKFPFMSLAKPYFSETSVDPKKDDIFFEPICDKFHGRFLYTDLEFPKNDPEFVKYKKKNWEGWDQEEMTKIVEKKLKDFMTNDSDWEKCLDQSVLNQKNAKNGIFSPIYYTSLADHQNHWWGKRNLPNFYYLFRFQKELLSLKNYLLKQHPNIPLIVLSDHGGQNYYGEDIAAVHGFQSPDNNAILFISMDYLQNNGAEQKIDYLDATATVSQIFKNVNIPLLSEGTPHSLYKDNFSKFLSAFSHFNQLRQYLTALKKHDSHEIKHIIKKLNYSKLEEAIKKQNDIISPKISLDKLFSKEGNSLNIEQNIVLLNQASQDLGKLVKKLQNKNEEIKAQILEYQKGNKKIWVFVCLILLSLFVTGLVIFLNKVIVKQLYTDIKKDTLLGKLVWGIGIFMMFTDVIFAGFVIQLKTDFLEISNYVFFGFKFILFALLIIIYKREIKENKQHNNNNSNESNIDFHQKSGTMDQQHIELALNNEGDIQIKLHSKSDIEFTAGNETASTQESVATASQYEKNKIKNRNANNNTTIQENENITTNLLENKKVKTQNHTPMEVQIMQRFIYEPLKSLFPKNIPWLIQVLLISFVFNIVSFILTFTDSYMQFKLHSYVLNDGHIPITILLFIIYYLYITSDSNGVLYNKKDGIYRNKWIRELDMGLFRILIILMTIYELNMHDKTKTLWEFNLNILIMVPLGWAFGYKIYSVIIPNDPIEKDQFQHTLMGVAKIVGITLTFYIADSVDRIFILTFILPISSLFVSVIKDKNSTTKEKLLAMFCLFREAGIIYIQLKGSFEFGFNRAAANKVLGRQIEDTPIVGAQLQGAAKIQAYTIPFMFIFPLLLFRKTEKSIITFGVQLYSNTAENSKCEAKLLKQEKDKSFEYYDKNEQQIKNEVETRIKQMSMLKEGDEERKLQEFAYYVKKYGNRMIRHSSDNVLRQVVSEHLDEATVKEYYNQFKRIELQDKINKLKQQGFKSWNITDNIQEIKKHGKTEFLSREQIEEFMNYLIKKTGLSVGEVLDVKGIYYKSQEEVEDEQKIKRRKGKDYDELMLEEFELQEEKNKQAIIQIFKQTQLDQGDINKVVLKKKMENQEVLYKKMWENENQNYRNVLKQSSPNPKKFIRKHKSTSHYQKFMKENHKEIMFKLAQSKNKSIKNVSELRELLERSTKKNKKSSDDVNSEEKQQQNQYYQELFVNNNQSENQLQEQQNLIKQAINTPKKAEQQNAVKGNISQTSSYQYLPNHNYTTTRPATTISFQSNFENSSQIKKDMFINQYKQSPQQYHQQQRIFSGNICSIQNLIENKSESEISINQTPKHEHQIENSKQKYYFTPNQSKLKSVISNNNNNSFIHNKSALRNSMISDIESTQYGQPSKMQMDSTKHFRQQKPKNKSFQTLGGQRNSIVSNISQISRNSSASNDKKLMSHTKVININDINKNKRNRPVSSILQLNKPNFIDIQSNYSSFNTNNTQNQNKFNMVKNEYNIQTESTKQAQNSSFQYHHSNEKQKLQNSTTMHRVSSATNLQPKYQNMKSITQNNNMQINSIQQNRNVQNTNFSNNKQSNAKSQSMDKVKTIREKQEKINLDKNEKRYDDNDKIQNQQKKYNFNDTFMETQKERIKREINNNLIQQVRKRQLQKKQAAESKKQDQQKVQQFIESCEYKMAYDRLEKQDYEEQIQLLESRLDKALGMTTKLNGNSDKDLPPLEGTFLEFKKQRYFKRKLVAFLLDRVVSTNQVMSNYRSQDMHKQLVEEIGKNYENMIQEELQKQKLIEEENLQMQQYIQSQAQISDC